MSNDSPASIVSKVWNDAYVFKKAKIGYSDYAEQITCPLFLKLADEMTKLGFDNPGLVGMLFRKALSKISTPSKVQLVSPSWLTN